MGRQTDGAARAAMVIMALDNEKAAKVLKHMTNRSLTKLRETVATMQVSEIGDKEKKQALANFLEKSRKGSFFLGNPDERFRMVLTQAKGPEEAQRLLKVRDVGQTAPPEDPLEYIQSAPAEKLASALASESPRCCAVLLAKLDPQKAGAVLNLIPPEAREPIVQRLFDLRKVPLQVTRDIAAGFRQKLEQEPADARNDSEEQRAGFIANLMSTLSKDSRDKIIARMSERDPQAVEKLQRLMFQFDDLVRVDGRSIQALLRKVDATQLALALKGAPEPVYKHLFSNMSERVRERINEEMQLLGRVRMAQVQNARDELMDVAREMVKQGEIEVELGEEEYVE